MSTYNEVLNHVLTAENDELIPLPLKPEVTGAPCYRTWYRQSLEGKAPPIIRIKRKPHIRLFAWRKFLLSQER